MTMFRAILHVSFFTLVMCDAAVSMTPALRHVTIAVFGGACLIEMGVRRWRGRAGQ